MIVPDLFSRTLVGRGPELTLLEDVRRDLGRSRGTAVCIGGEAGIGKSRLLFTFMSSSTVGRRRHCVQTACLAFAARPYGPIRDLLAALDASSPWALREAPAFVRSAFAAVVHAAGALVPGEATLDKSEIYAGVVAFVEAVAAKRAIVAAIEDIHWADPASLELLEYAVPRLARARVMLVVTYRNDHLAPGHPLFAPLARLVRESNVRRIELEPLDEGEVRLLIDDVIDGRVTVDRPRRRAIAKRSQGNPFFIEELLKDSVSQTQSGPVHPLPISIRALIIERLAGLTDDDRRVVSFGALLGPEFDAATLALVTETGAALTLATLRRLRDRNLVVERPAQPGTFAFRHALTREAIASDLLATDARAMHARVAAILERAGTGEHLAALAYHTWAAGAIDAALGYNERAGDVALNVFASVDAGEYFERALASCTLDADRLRLLGKCAEAARQRADFAASIELFDSQYSLALRLADYDTAALAITRACGEMATIFRTRDAIERFARFMNDYGSRVSTSVADHVNTANARVATADENVARARELLAAVRDPEALASLPRLFFWATTMFSASLVVDRAAWLAAVARLRELLADAPPLLRAQLLHSIGGSAIRVGESAIAMLALDEAVALDIERGFTRALAFASGLRARVLLALGRLAEARAAIETSLVDPEMLIARLQTIASAPFVGSALGDGELIDRCLDRDVIRRLEETPNSEIDTVLCLGRAALLVHLERPESARRLLAAKLRRPETITAEPAFFSLAARSVELGALDTVVAACRRMIANDGDRVMLATEELTLAIVAERRGERESARDHGTRAAARFAAIGWQLFEAQALELADDTGSALAIYRRCGATADVARLALADPRSPIDALSPREREIAVHVARGYTNRRVAAEIGVSEKTIEKHLSAAYLKLGIGRRAELAAMIGSTTETKA